MAYFQRDCLSIASRNLLAQLLSRILTLSDAIEPHRAALAQVPHFDCIALFRFLDRQEKGFLRERDLQRAVGSSHRKLLSYAFSWLDAMKVGEISRLEFAAFLLPKDDLHLRQLVAARVQNPANPSPQNETLLHQFQLFQHLLTEIMKHQMKVIELRRQLLSQSDYSIRGVMQALDGHGHGWVCGEDMQKYLKNYGVEAGLRQVEKLVEVVNYTLDGRVTEEQLRWTVEGFENKNKSYLDKIKKANKKQFEKKRNRAELGSENHTPRTAKSILTTEEKTASVNKTTANKATPSAHTKLTPTPHSKATPNPTRTTPIQQMASPQPFRESPSLPKAPPSSQSKELTIHHPPTGEQNPHHRQYHYLLERFRLAVEEEQQIDLQLRKIEAEVDSKLILEQQKAEALRLEKLRLEKLKYEQHRAQTLKIQEMKAQQKKLEHLKLEELKLSQIKAQARLQQQHQRLQMQRSLEAKQRDDLHSYHQQIEELRLVREREQLRSIEREELQSVHSGYRVKDWSYYLAKDREDNETERLRKLDERLTTYTEGLMRNRPYSVERMEQSPPKSCQTYQPRPSFPINQTSIYVPLRKDEPQIPLRRDYAHLTDLNCLSVVQSYRKPSERSEQPLPTKPLADSSKTPQQPSLQQKTRKQREIEKSIHEQFSNGQYTTSRFNSRIADSKVEKSLEKSALSPNIHIEDRRSVVYESPERVSQFTATANFIKNTVSTSNKETEREKA